MATRKTDYDDDGLSSENPSQDSKSYVKGIYCAR